MQSLYGPYFLMSKKQQNPAFSSSLHRLRIPHFTQATSNLLGLILDFIIIALGYLFASFL